MRMRNFINETGFWPTPDVAALPSATIEVDTTARLGDVAALALRETGHKPSSYWLWAVELPDDEGRRLMTNVPVVVSDDGAFTWPPHGQLDQITIQEMTRARERGFFAGDPQALCIDLGKGGNGILIGWEELFRWLAQGAIVGGTGWAARSLLAVLRRHYERWKRRGAKTAFAFLDVVPTRNKWSPDELSHLLELNQREVNDLLASLGYERDPETAEFILDPNSDAGTLRRAILRQFLYRDGDEGFQQPETE